MARGIHSITRSGAAIAAALFFLPCASATAQSMLHVFDGDAGEDYFGWSVARLGDVDGDGNGDLLVGAPGAAAGAYAGLVRLFSGASGAILLEITGAASNDQFGFSVSGMGDVNGDSVPDFVVGAPSADSTSTVDVGSAFVYSGADGALIHEFVGLQRGGAFGWSVSGLGDMDGDLFDDLIVGAPYQTPMGGGTDAGCVFMYSGDDGALLHERSGDSADDLFGISVGCGEDNALHRLAMPIVGAPTRGTGPTPEGYARVFGASGKVANTFHGDSAGDLFGWSVDGAGDVDEDGNPDVIVGAPGVAFFGGSSGMARIYSSAADAELFSLYGTDAGGLVGASVSGAGDVNLDGAAELLVGAPGIGLGVARLYSGATQGLLATLEGGPLNDTFGASVDGAGDVDADGLIDQLVGAPDLFGEGINPGQAWVFAGRQLYLTLNDSVFVTGDWFEAIAHEGTSKDPVMLVVIAIDGKPAFLVLGGVATFDDATGDYRLGDFVPKGLEGVTIELAAFAILGKGKVQVSNVREAVFK